MTITSITLPLDGVTLELLRIPPGKFMMGSPETEPGRFTNEGPQHLVRIAGEFYLGKHPVTQAQWRAVMGDNPSYFKGDDRPVECVSWEDCWKFCTIVNERTGPLTIRLPSEAEWEYACRAGTTTPFFYGETISPEQANFDGGFLKATHRGKTTRIGMFSANAFGLHDMHGNVQEWCDDRWHQNYDGAPSDGSVWTTDDYDGGGFTHVLRGGSWFSFADCVRSAYRNRHWANDRYNYVGFRPAANVMIDI